MDTVCPFAASTAWETTQMIEVKAKVVTGLKENEDYVHIDSFERRIILTHSKGSAGVISHPSHCTLPESEFTINIDPTKLEPGKVHYSEIVGIDPQNRLLGPLFRLPITVVIPEEVTQMSRYCYKKKLTLKPAAPQRIFLKAPIGTIVFTEFCYPLNPSDALIEPMKERDNVDGYPSFPDISTYYKFKYEGYKNYKKHIDCFLLQIYTSTKKLILTTSYAEAIILESGLYTIRVQYRNTDNDVLNRLQHAPLLVTESIHQFSQSLFTDGTALISHPNRFEPRQYQACENDEFFMEPIFFPNQIYPSGSYYKGRIFLQSTNFFSSKTVTYEMANSSPVKNNNNVSFEKRNDIPQIAIQHNPSLSLLYEAVEIAMNEKDALFLQKFIQHFTQNQRALTDYISLAHALYNFVNGLLDETIISAEGTLGILSNVFEEKNGNVEASQHSSSSAILPTSDYNMVSRITKQLLLNMKNGDNDNPISPYPLPDHLLPLLPNQNLQDFVVNMSLSPDSLPHEFEMIEAAKNVFFDTKVEKVYQNYMLFVEPTSENVRMVKAKYAVAHKRFATAITELKLIIANKSPNSNHFQTEKFIIELFKRLGWKHLTEEAQNAFLIKYQQFYRLF
uniref:Tripeptidyl peptidase II Ig-like domain-containing protein n=1 Tax=Panagrolaimus davidi TaxID=227884 RepID=A0A914P6A7_9BILA